MNFWMPVISRTSSMGTAKAWCAREKLRNCRLLADEVAFFDRD